MEHRNDSDEPDEEQLKQEPEQEPEQEPAQEPEETLGASSGGGGAPSPARTRQPPATLLDRESARARVRACVCVRLCARVCFCTETIKAEFHQDHFLHRS